MIKPTAVKIILAVLREIPITQITIFRRILLPHPTPNSEKKKKKKKKTQTTLTLGIPCDVNSCDISS
jgi:hypothetical protein